MHRNIKHAFKTYFSTLKVLLPLALCLSPSALCLSPSSAFASDCQWKETTGEAAVENITAEEARQLALNRARNKAVEEIAGVKVQGSSLVKNFTLAADFIQAMSAGYVLEENAVKWETGTYQERPEAAPLTTYKVTLKSCVASVAAGDPYFSIKAELNRPVFISGEEARITASCTKDCFLTILNLTADNKIRLLLPNKYEPSVRLKANAPYSFPVEGMALEMHTLPGHSRDTEAFLVIATREKFDILGLLKKGEEIPQKEFYKAILSLPADTRAEAMVVYEVRER